MNTTLMTAMPTGTHRTWAFLPLSGTGLSFAPVNGSRPVFGAELGGLVTGPVGGYLGRLGSTAPIAQDSKVQDVRDPRPPRDHLF